MSRDALMPRRPDRIGPGLLLALIVHVGLVIAIAIGVSWRSRAPEAMSAELWSAVPQQAAPRLAAPEPVPVPKPAAKLPPTPKVDPPPAPPQPQVEDAQIAIEKAQREKEERQRQADEDAQRQRQEAQRQRDEQRRKDEAAAAEKQRQELERKKQAAEEARREAERKKAEEALIAQARKDQQRIMGTAGASGDPGSTGTARQSSGPSSNYAGRVAARVRPNIVYTEDPPGNPYAEFEVRAAPDGTILGTPRLTKSSGIPSWDDAAQRAIIKTETLPRDVDGRVPSPITIALRPRN